MNVETSIHEEKQRKIKEFFQDRPSLSVAGIEKEAKLSRTLDHFLHGRRSIPENHIDSLIAVLKKYGFSL